MPASLPPNDQPLDDFEGLTPHQVHHLLHDFLGPASIVKLQSPDSAAPWEAIPLPFLARQLLDDLAQGEVRLTAKGNLPGKLVKAYYATGRLPDYAVETGLHKLRGEDDYPPLQAVKHVLLQLGWIKKRNNRLSLTAKGKSARGLAGRQFFQDLFLTHLRRFNLGWMDLYPESSVLQHVIPYLTYLMLVLGATVRSPSEYTDRLRRAFPFVEEEFPGRLLNGAVTVRLFDRLLSYYGFVTLTRERFNPHRPAELAVTDLFRSVFTLDPQASPAPQTEEERYERQLKMALFDAEMGSQTQVSDDLPLHLIDHFQQQIRKLQEQQQQGEAVRIGDLLGATDLPAPREVTDETTARHYTARIINSLRERGIDPQDVDAEAMDAFSRYAFFHDLVLNYEIVPPPPGTRRVVTVEEVLMTQFDPVEALTETFLLALFDLDTPFPADLLADRMRLNQQVVPKARAIDHLNRWREQFHHITPLSLEILADGPPVDTPTERQAVQFFQVGYETVAAPGEEPQALTGPGVVECILENGEWRITGAQIPGFAF